MLKKADDFYIALLLYINTPPQGHTYSPAQRMFLRRTRIILLTTDHLLAPAVINFGVVKEDILKKGIIAKHTTTRRQVQSTTQSAKLAITHLPNHHPVIAGKPWIYEEVIKKDNGRSYTFGTSHGTTIRRNRVQLKPAAAPPPFIQPRTAVNSAPVDTTVYPTPAPNPSKQADVHPQDEQQTHKQPNTASEAIPETPPA